MADYPYQEQSHMSFGLTLEDIHIKRGKKHIAGPINLHFSKGCLTAIIGPNGAGKTSLIETCAGLLKPASGAISLDGIPLSKWTRSMLAKKRAFLPQRASVGWPLTVERVVALGLTPNLPAFGNMPQAMYPAIKDALKTMGLIALRDRSATTLSGGELARVMLARAIVNNPDYLLIDEPIAGLDPRHAHDSVSRLAARAKAGAAVIMAIHDLELALNHADVLIAIKAGQITAAGPVSSVATQEILSHLYDMPVAVQQDSHGYAVRFSQSALEHC